jgi:hypothetical protein
VRAFGVIDVPVRTQSSRAFGASLCSDMRSSFLCIIDGWVEGIGDVLWARIRPMALGANIVGSHLG